MQSSVFHLFLFSHFAVGLSGYYFNSQKNKIGRILKKYFVLTLLRPEDIGPAMVLIKQDIKTTVTQG
jgi:hypothetical protein